MSDAEAIVKYLDERDQVITAKAYALGAKDLAALRHLSEQLAEALDRLKLETDSAVDRAPVMCRALAYALCDADRALAAWRAFRGRGE